MMCILQEYKLIRPVVSKQDKERQKRYKKEKEGLLEQFDEIEVSLLLLHLSQNIYQN